MSRETLEWLNTNTLIGFTEKRGNAWHHRAGTDNHFRGPVPVEVVHKRLFNWEAVQVPEMWMHNGRIMKSERDSVVIRSDTGHKMGTFRNGYQPHQYGEWLIRNVSNILDDDLMIGSAGLLKGGAVAWVSVEVPETCVTPEGVSFRPFLLARTSFDGSLSTTYGRAVTNTVCDNTMEVAAGEHAGQQVKVRHSSKSLEKVADVRDALGIVHGIADDFAAEVAKLCDVSVTDAMFDKIVDDMVPFPDEPEEHKAAVTLAEKKRDALWNLWTKDERVTPWHGSAMGAWQAFNTYGQHIGHVRGMSRQERNMLNTVTGDIQSTDADVKARILTLAS